MRNGQRHTDLNIAERVRRELNTAISNPNGNNGAYYGSTSSYKANNVANGVSCTTECRFLPGQSGRSQSELDILAREMTNQIVHDLRTGKLTRTQVNQPNWFENRVAERLSDFQREHQSEFERNLQSVSNRFHQSQQQQQQSHGSQFQQQSQSYGYVQPIVTGNSYEKVVEERHNEHNTNTVYPTPVTVYHGAAVISRNNNCSDQIYGNLFPRFNLQNQFKQRVESNRQMNTGYVAPIVLGGSSYQVEEKHERKEHHAPQIPVIMPTQSTYSRQFVDEQREVHRQRPQTYVPINQQNRKTHVESSSIRNVQIVTPAPIPVATNIVRHDVHDYFRESSEVVPNYRPRVVLDSNTKFHDLEVRNRQHENRPIIPISPTLSTRVTEESEQIDRQYQQRPTIRPQVAQTVHTEEEHIDHQYQQRPTIQPQATQTHVTQEEQFEINQHKHQRPYYRPTQQTITQTEDDDIQQTIHQPQYPVFSHTSSVKSFNESQHNTNQQSQTVHYRPGQTVTTIKETHSVKILPQPANQYVVQYNDREYLERLNRIQQELRRLGYGVLTEEEYNTTISLGGFIHNGYKYLYNEDHGRYEKADRVEVTEEEYHSLLRGLQHQLHQLGVQMTENEFNQTIEDGYFVQNGIRYIFDSESGTYHRQDVDEEQYELLRHNILDESNKHGWSLTNHEINQTIATGYLTINGHRYILNKQTGILEQGEDLQISEQEYRTILRRLQEQLAQLGFDQMTEREYNHTISTGYFVRDGNKYRYNADIGRYEKVEITEEEYKIIANKLKETLQRLNYRQMTEQEIKETIATGTFIRGGYQWSYNRETGKATAIRKAYQFEEISDTEYATIYRHLQTLLRNLGYPAMSEIECNSTIVSGAFLRGGNQWVYQPSSGEFERIELSESEFNYRIERLKEILNRLGIQKTFDEQRNIINRGNLFFGGHRYEYDMSSETFVRIEMSKAEYQKRVRQLLEQLQGIGYGTMTESECQATINSGVFYYGGHEWVYNYQTEQYEIGKDSNKENGIVDDDFYDNIGFDNTRYNSSKTDEPETTQSFDIDRADDNQNNRRKEIISKNRGDQPPQIFEEDYDEAEEPTQRPIQPVIRPTQAATRPPFVPSYIPPFVSTLAPYTSVTDRRRIESEQQQTIYALPTPQTDYEERYHHKKTTYTKTSGYVS